MSNNKNTFRLVIEALISVPTGTLGTILDLLRRVNHPESGEKFTEDLKAWLRGSSELVKKPIIKWLDTITTSATTEKFVAREKFRKDSKEVKIYGFYGTFGEDFLSLDVKIEQPLGEQVLRYGDLTKNSVDGAIIEELGGGARAETTLTELYDLLKKQGNGQKKGALLTNGHANIFYIRNTFGVLRAVGVLWVDVVWGVGASSVEDPFAWNAGGRVFSRNS